MLSGWFTHEKISRRKKEALRELFVLFHMNKKFVSNIRSIFCNLRENGSQPFYSCLVPMSIVFEVFRSSDLISFR